MIPSFAFLIGAFVGMFLGLCLSALFSMNDEVDE